MVKFVSVLGITGLVVILTSLLWPRFSPKSRPVPLQRVHDFLLTTPVGIHAAVVLGVSDDQTVVPITPQSLSQQITESIRSRLSDVLITNAVRIITKRFKYLPQTEQEKVLDAFSSAISEPGPSEASPSQNLANPTQ